MTTSVNEETEIVANGKLVQAAMTGAVLAIAANVIILYMGRAFGVPFELVPPFSSAMEQLNVMPLIGASVLPAIAAAILLAILPRYTPRPFTWFYIISVVVVILSFSGPSGTPTDSAATVTGLNIMHVVTALMIAGAFGAIAHKNAKPIQ